MVYTNSLAKNLLLLALIVISLTVRAEVASVADFLNPNGTFKTTGLHSNSFTLDLTGWRITLDSVKGPILTPNIQAADGTWSALGNGLNNDVAAIVVKGNNIYVGGRFTGVFGDANPVEGLNYIAKWDGNVWSALGNGLNEYVDAIAVKGNDIYVGGGFTGPFGHSRHSSDSPDALNYIAKWDGTTWSALDKGLNNMVSTIAVSGTDIYLGGDFTGPFGVSRGQSYKPNALNQVAKWNGTSWSPLGRGLNQYVRTITVSGTDVYVGGDFSYPGVGGPSMDGLKLIAKWDGSNWSSLDGGLSRAPFAMAIADKDLYVVGHFQSTRKTAGTQGGFNKVAKWDGTAWSTLDRGLGIKEDLDEYECIALCVAVHDNSVYVGGNFTQVGKGGKATPGLNYIAKWSKELSLKPLNLYWSAGRTDNYSAATTTGEQAAKGAGYQFIRSMGYVHKEQVPGTKPLKLYWSAQRRDNFTTATQEGELAARGVGYQFIRILGYIYEEQVPGSKPLKLFWSSTRNDNYSTSTEAGEAAARGAGYQFIRVMGYVMEESK